MLRCAVLLIVVSFSQAAVTRVEVVQRTDMPGGSYEQITGKVYFAVDPKLPANKIITDIDLAPRNAAGDGGVFGRSRRDAAEGSGEEQWDGAAGDFESRRAGDGQYVDLDGADWRSAVVRIRVHAGVGGMGVRCSSRGLKLYAPVIRGITGVVRSEITLDKRATAASLGDRAMIPYAVADQGSATLTVRDRVNSPRTTISRDQWKFNADATGVEYPAGFEPGRIYEVVYTGKDPAVVGLGPAAVRDYISYMKQQGEVKRAIGFGDFAERAVFADLSYITGSMRMKRGSGCSMACGRMWRGRGAGSFDHRFAQPSRDGHPLLDMFYPSDVFPFTDEAETDEGITEGLLSRARKDGVVPKIFYTNGSYEYWGRAASLIHISPDGKKDVAPAPDTRIYYLAGTQHGPNAQPVKTVTQNLPNPTDYRFAMRALLVDMNAWVTEGRSLRRSQIPHIDKDQLVAPSALAFPTDSGDYAAEGALSGVAYGFRAGVSDQGDRRVRSAEGGKSVQRAGSAGGSRTGMRRRGSGCRKRRCRWLLIRGGICGIRRWDRRT